MKTSTKEYSFYGTNKRTEIIIMLMYGIIVAPIYALISIIIGSKLGRLNGSIIALIGLCCFGMLYPLVVLIGSKIKKKWIITYFKDQLLVINYGSQSYEIRLDEIKQVKNYGDCNFRYFTLKTPNKKICIRLGTSVPFSKKGDIEILDSFIKEIQPYLDKNFNKKGSSEPYSLPSFRGNKREGIIKVKYSKD